MRAHPLALALLGSIASLGCPGDAGQNDTTANPTSSGLDTLSATGTEGDGGHTDDASTGGADDTSTGGGSVCETVLCGQPVECCAAEEDCVLGACVPACESGVRCGAAQDVCCDSGQVCLADQCVDPTGACVDSFDCDFGQFCEPTLGQCLPQLDPVACEIIPEFEDIAVIEEWAYTDHEVISIPVVADLDGDLAPEVVVNLTQLDGGSWPAGRIVVLDGATGAVQLDLPHDPASDQFGAHGRATLGLSDVSGDGLPDVVYAGRPSGGESAIHAIDGTGAHLWSSHDPGGATHTFTVENGAPAFGNFDDDDEAETVFGATLIDDDGLVVWDQAGAGAAFGTNGDYTGGISAVVDLTGDGYPEIVSGRHAWSVQWTQPAGMDPQVVVTPLWDAGAPDGYPAIADLDGDGDPEVVLVAGGTVRVLDGATGEAWCGIDATGAACAGNDALRTAAADIPGGGIGGPPTIADFDGDGRPEIATAGGSSYTVYDLARPDEEIVVAAGFPAPADGEIYPRWTQATQDQSSNATGSSVFDFQGDGAAEVVYADECYMRVYDGATGEVVLEIESSSATIHEYPLVVDVDDDGNSEILVVANDSGQNCDAIAGYTYRRGLYVYGDQFDEWVGTRRVWSSHTYHVTNVTSSGNAPAVELDNWTQPGLNNYRQNVQGAGVFNAPDLAVELSAELAACIDEQLVIVATVRNVGSLGVPAGVEVSLYAGMDASAPLVGTLPTPDPLLPGGQVELSWTIEFVPGSPALELFVTVDGASADLGAIAECDERNNDAATVSAECPVPG
jgi:hypothetical protein